MQSAAFLRKIYRKSYFDFATTYLKIKFLHSAKLLIIKFLETFYGKPKSKMVIRKELKT